MATSTASPQVAGDSTISPREHLQTLIRAAGYDRRVLEAVADAALHPHQPAPGEKATDRQLRQICAAVDVLMTAGRSNTQVLTRLNGFRDAGGDWRLEFWRAELTEANRRFNTAQAQDATVRAADDITAADGG